MTRRLDSAARDYAIALVAIGRINGFHDVLRRIDLRLARDMEDAEDEVCETTWQHDGFRLVRARVALYLRLLRRVEAWERAGRYTFTHWSSFKRRHADGEDVFCVEAVRSSTGDRMVSVALLQATPWRPLWTSAPPHDPGVTARMRREVPGPEVV